MKLAVNTSPLIFLASIEKLDLLEKYTLFVPVEVAEEFGRKEDSRYFTIKKFLKKKNVNVIKIDLLSDLPESLGKGEKAAISLAKNKNILHILIDERKARNIAKAFGLVPRGTLAVLISALQNRKITKKECKKLIFELIRQGFRINQKLLAEILLYLE
ncbi:MAG: DUF3368 domain-containing protein [Nanoarchaeota archaeon]|nr:DUF3368 domain-containing protein [Nanoarchaeota archaeon]